MSLTALGLAVAAANCIESQYLMDVGTELLIRWDVGPSTRRIPTTTGDSFAVMAGTIPPHSGGSEAAVWRAIDGMAVRRLVNTGHCWS